MYDIFATDKLIDLWLTEDIGICDLTVHTMIEPGETGTFCMNAREPMLIAGIDVAARIFSRYDPTLSLDVRVADGDKVEKGAVLLNVSGNARSVLTAERTALNFVQRLSGVATMTAQFVQQVAGTNVQILDTRKTTPGWRALEKYAVACGGGTNHRIGLYDQVMIKDNHLAALEGNMAEAIRRARENYPDLKIEAEADTVEQAQAAAEAGADIILLDNMSCDELRQAVGLIDGRAKTEASGGVTLETVREIAETGVDYISVGALTHSAPSVDIALDFDQLA